MSDDLRTRIAAVIYRLDAEQQGYEAGLSVCSPWSLKVADAVIRELEKTSFVHCRAKETSPGAVPKTVAAVSAPGEDLIPNGAATASADTSAGSTIPPQPAATAANAPNSKNANAADEPIPP